MIVCQRNIYSVSQQSVYQTILQQLGRLWKGELVAQILRLDPDLNPYDFHLIHC